MSAWIVSRFHIHQLVTAIDTYVCSHRGADRTRDMLLWNECIDSVKYRYNDEPLQDLPGPIDETYLYFYIKPQRQLTPVEVHTMTRSYQYQSCEHDGWEASEACHLTDALLQAIEEQLGKTRADTRLQRSARRALVDRRRYGTRGGACPATQTSTPYQPGRHRQVGAQSPQGSMAYGEILSTN